MDRRTWKEPVDERIVADGLFLEQRAMLHIARGAGLLISASTGALWITQDGNLDDIVLTSGQWHRLDGDAVIASALQATIVTISAPLAATPRWKIQRVSAAGMRDEVRSPSRGNRVMRAVQAWVLRRYRSGAQAARRVQQSARDAEFRDSVERLVAQLDARARKDIGLEAFHGASPAERAERYRWRQEFTWPSRESTFI